MNEGEHSNGTPHAVTTCLSKVCHASESAALEAASLALRREDIEVDTLRVYACAQCNGYHLTSKPYRTPEQLHAYREQLQQQMNHISEHPADVIRAYGARQRLEPNEEPSVVWIPTRKDGHISDVDSFNAFLGFNALNDELTKQGRGERYHFRFYQNYFDFVDRRDIFIGGVNQCCNVMREVGAIVPESFDYPDALKPYLHREVRTSTVADLMNDVPADGYPIFVKPVLSKQFHGQVIHSLLDWEGLLHLEGARAYACEVFTPLCEWRYFVLNGVLQGARYYAGSYDDTPPIRRVVERAISEFEASGQAPAAYVLDFARDCEGRTVLIEANDCYALGSYDLDSKTYARMLEARWKQIMATYAVTDGHACKEVEP